MVAQILESVIVLWGSTLLYIIFIFSYLDLLAIYLLYCLPDMAGTVYHWETVTNGAMFSCQRFLCLEPLNKI